MADHHIKSSASGPVAATTQGSQQSLPLAWQKRPFPRIQASANSSNPVVEAALTWRGKRFSDAHYGMNPYCASFVRWCFAHGLGKMGTLPVVLSPPYYRKLGLHFAPGEWFADSLAGDEVGALVQHQQAGDILLFRDTCRGFPPGTITHVGIAADAGQGMLDAGSESLVHLRSYTGTFPGLLVETRRPKHFMSAQASNARRTTLLISGGHAFGTYKGRPVRSLGIAVGTSGGSGAQPHWEIYVDGRPVQPVIAATLDVVFDAGQHFKLFWHDHRVSGLLNGAPVKDALALSVDLVNGTAHVLFNHKEVKPGALKFEVVS
jgi:hypothetical protein